MHYYKRHLGDYAKDTGHLTALEHGVYTLLMDWYYANERPIPPDKATRIARGNPDETQTVLTEFFKLTDAGWTHSYADRVIAEYNVKAERNREIGKLGGRPKTQTVSKPNPDVTLATNHKPLTTKEQKQKHTSRAAPVFLEAPEWMDRESWAEWCDYRKGRKWTPRAQALSLAKLRELLNAGQDPAAVIRQSIAASWTGLFPLKTNGASHEASRRLSAVDRVRASALAGELADRTAHQSNGSADLVGSHGRDLRTPLDDELRGRREP